MKLGNILKSINIIFSNVDFEKDITGICCDSRKVQPGNVFVAIDGFASDGHRYIPSALEKGASVIICEKKQDDTVPQILTDNSRLALALASSEYYGNPTSKMTMIGLTGTNGKTTATYLIKHILEQTENAKVGLIGTNMNMIGSRELHTERTTPESVELQELFSQMADESCTHCVMEVSSHSLVLDRVGGIEYNTSLFTNLTRDHLDFHGTMEEYAKAKALLFSRSKYSVINLDDMYSPLMLSSAKENTLTFSTRDERADLYAANVKLTPSSISFDAVYKGQNCPVELGIPGKFSVYNALGSIACCLSMGVSLRDCADALKNAKGVKGRAEPVYSCPEYTILIDYAHTPDALENIIGALRVSEKSRIVVLFGCGGDRDKTKRPLMGKIGTEEADYAIITSDNPRTEDPLAIIDDILAGVSAGKDKYTVIPDRREAIRYAIENHLPGDIIILAGKGHETYQEINHVKHHMDEREIVADILADN